MRNFTIFALFCVALATVLAVPASIHVPHKAVISKVGLEPGNLEGVLKRVLSSDFLTKPSASGIKDKAQLDIVLKRLLTMEYTPKDWLSDMIGSMLGKSVGELLNSINTSLEQLKNLITLGVQQLKTIMASVDAQTQQEIENIINQALGEALTIIAPILDDLGLVLPVITRSSSSIQESNAADLIAAILGISLEELLHNVTTALEKSDDLLSRTMNELLNLSERVSDSGVSEDLEETSEQYLNQGKSVIRPVLDSLYQVLPGRINPKGLVSNIISTSLGFEVVPAARQLELTLSGIESTLVRSVAELDEILYDADENVRNKANDLVVQAVENIYHTIQPILDVLLQFAPISHQKGRNKRPSVSDIVNTLLGVSLEDFLTYIDFASERVNNTIGNITLDVQEIANQGGLLLGMEVLKWSDRTIDSLALTIQPFLEIIDPVISPNGRVWVSREEFTKQLRSKASAKPTSFCNFSLQKGFNKELIMDMISSILDINVTAAGELLQPSLRALEELLTNKRRILDEILSDYDQGVNMDVNLVIEGGLVQILKVIQPLLDIFLHFVPNEARLDKDIVNDIFDAVISVSLEDFQFYLAHAKTRVQNITEQTIVRVENAVSDQRPAIKLLVQQLTERTLEQAEEILQAFLDNIQMIHSSFPTTK